MSISERLDKVVASEEWSKQIYNKEIETLASGRPNHLPLLLSIKEVTKSRQKTKKISWFEAKWIQKFEREQIIKKIWEGSPNRANWG